MRLYIAEKPSLGRAIADALPGPHQRAEGCVYVGNGDCVSWCIGHLLEQAEPDAYDAAYQQWRFEHLPIIPQQWQLQAKASTKKQLAVLRKLVKAADEIVHAGDPDREGQLLVDQVIEFLGIRGQAKQGIQRCLINDLNPPAVKRALNHLRNNRDFVPLSVSALARARADWLYGINMTRAFTLQGRKVGYDGVLSVGRVQTPVLGLVVRRDRAIEDFVSKPFYDVLAHIDAQSEIGVKRETFKAKWQPSEACQPYQDEEGRVLSLGLAQKVVSSIQGQPALVTAISRAHKRQAPPLPYHLSALQIDAAKQYGFSAQQVLDGCQALYEQHKLLTYPRSDCRYLPEEHFAQADSVVSAIAHNSEGLVTAATQADTRLRSKTWNNAKVGAHHAIIPTAKTATIARLPQVQQRLYTLVARQYLAQFYPHHQYQDSEIHLEIAGGHFVAKSRQTTAPGWKSLFKKNAQESQDKPVDASLNPSLPMVNKGDQLLCLEGELLEKQTSPPKAFNDASLLAAMTGIGRYVDDKALRSILKETDGLGTEATRAGIIELLFKRGFLLRQGKQIRASETGRALIDSLPTIATQADMTARWEMELNAISRRQASYQGFMQPLETLLQRLIQDSQNQTISGLSGLKAQQSKTQTQGGKKRDRSKGRSRKARSTHPKKQGKTPAY